MSDERFPVGPFGPKPTITPAERSELIRQIADLPLKLQDAVMGLNDTQLETPYREGGWTVRQVVHHVADSHMNAYIRFRLALTEQHPTIKPYDQDAWAKLVDSRSAPIDLSLSLIEAMHERWVMMLEAMTPTEFARTIRHPETGDQNLDRVLQLYAWHGRHHTAHITKLREKRGW